MIRRYDTMIRISRVYEWIDMDRDGYDRLRSNRSGPLGKRVGVEGRG